MSGRRFPLVVLATEVFDVPPSGPPSRAIFWLGVSRPSTQIESSRSPESTAAPQPASSVAAVPATRSKLSRPVWFDFPWTALLVGLAILATVLHRFAPTIADWIVADARIARGDVWRLATGPFVHATWGHLVRDAALVALVGVAYEAPLARTFGWFVAFALVVPTTAVLVATDASWYCGLSGVSHACFAAAIMLELRQRRGVIRGFVLGLGLAFAAKPLYELVTGVPAFPMDLGPDVRQVPLAHLTGVLVGIVMALFGHIFDDAA